MKDNVKKRIGLQEKIMNTSVMPGKSREKERGERGGKGMEGMRKRV